MDKFVEKRLERSILVANREESRVTFLRAGICNISQSVRLIVEHTVGNRASSREVREVAVGLRNEIVTTEVAVSMYKRRWRLYIVVTDYSTSKVG